MDQDAVMSVDTQGPNSQDLMKQQNVVRSGINERIVQMMPLPLRPESLQLAKTKKKKKKKRRRKNQHAGPPMTIVQLLIASWQVPKKYFGNYYQSQPKLTNE